MAPQADDFFERVIGRTGDGKQLIARRERPEESHGDGMGAGCDTAAHQRGLGAHDLGHHALQALAPQIVVAIARGPGEVLLTDPILAKGIEHLARVVSLDRAEALPDRPHGGFCGVQEGFSGGHISL